MKTFQTPCCLFLVALAALGCQGPSSQDPKATNTTAPADAPVLTEPAPVSPSEEDAMTPASDSFADRDARPADASDSTDASDAEETPPRESKERAILLAPGGPIVIDFLVTVDGLAHHVALDRLINEELIAADANRDGRAKWREVANSPRFRYGQIASNPADIVRLYDSNRDGLVGHHELLRYLTRNVGPWHSFSLQSSHQDRDCSDSPLRRLLDDDRDGSISQTEMEQAAIRLKNLDANDDEIVTRAELEPDASQPPKPMALRRRADRPEVAWWIHPRTKWDYIQYSLAEMYASDETLTADDLQLTPDVAVALDTDEDGKVTGDEFRGLAEIPPHVVLSVVFGGSGESEPFAATHLKLQSLAECLKSAGVVVRATSRRVVLVWKDTAVQFFINEDPLLRIPTVAAADLDEDGRLSEYETTQYMSRRLAVYRGLIRGRAADLDKWFAALDTNGDGTLSFREIQESRDCLASLDWNEDGQLRPHEVPCAMAIGFVRGNPSQDDDLFARSPATRRTDPTVPRWFSGMDSNEDGEISRREFLGTPARFSDLDENEDGFIGPEEGASS
ncbi:MAG: hypothetical protein ACC628_16475 [Pirellulaceae bacterium]